jgi:hypothetical protein
MTTSSIGSNSRNYATVSLWWAACSANLVTATQTWEGELYNDSEFAIGYGGITLSGVTTSATYYAELRCASGQSFNDNEDKLTNALRYNVSNGVGLKQNYPYITVLTITCDYFNLIGVQIKSPSGQGSSSRALVLIGTNIIVSNSIFECGGGYATVNMVTTAGSKVVNSVIIASAASTGAVSTNYVNFYLYNCTLINTAGSTGVGVTKQGHASTNSSVVKNCAIFGFGTAITSGTWGADTDYNATDDGDAFPAGSNNLISLTKADQFENVAGLATLDLRVKSGNDLVAGTRDQTNTNDLDIVGQARSTSTPTIGAWEHAVAVGFSFLPIFNKKFITNNTLLRS